MPQGDLTRCGEMGARLSGGQRVEFLLFGLVLVLIQVHVKKNI